MPEKLKMRRVWNLNDPDVLSLVARSDEYLSSLYPPESNHAESLEALVGEDSAFFAGYADERLVACGAVKIVEEDVDYGEIKRVFVREEHRGKRFASKVMQHLETYLIKGGVKVVRLEAGPMQPEALALYRKLGYVERGPFGSYRTDPLSVFMEKTMNLVDCD
jgi:putative acetyltransferase